MNYSFYEIVMVMPTGFQKLWFAAFGLLDLVALVVAFILSIHALSIYFSYFTVLSNILATFVFLYIGGSKSKRIPPIVQRLYGPSVLYMTITGIIFWTILRANHHLTSAEWISYVMHGVMPVAVVAAWIFFRPKIKLKYSVSFIWLLFPLLFVGYTLARGPLVHWYPYPFLDSARVGGYLGVSKYVLGILFGSFVVSLVLIWLSNKKQS